MAKKHSFGAVLLVGAAAAAVAGGVISYIKRTEIKRLAEEIITKVKPTDTDGIYSADMDGDGLPDRFLADLDGDGHIDVMAVDAGKPNIVDSGISLESVEKAAQDSEDCTEAESQAEPENVESAAPASSEEAGAPAAEEEGTDDGDSAEPTDAEEADDGETKKKKIRFWSK